MQHIDRNKMEQRDWIDAFLMQFYAVSQNQLAIPGDGEETFSLQMPGDVDFLLQQLQFTINNTLGISSHLGLKVADTTGREYTDNFVHANYFSNSGSGHAERPINMNIPLRRNANLQITVKNFSSSSTSNLSISAIGRKNYSKHGFYLPNGKLWKQEFSLQYFAMGLNKQTIDALGGANDIKEFEFKMPGDEEFILEHIQVTADNETGDTYHLGCKLEDTTGRFYTEEFLNLNYFNGFGSGHAERPVNMNTPFRKNATFKITLKNFDSVALNNFSVSVIGRKNYSDFSFFQEDYE